MQNITLFDAVACVSAALAIWAILKWWPEKE